MSDACGHGSGRTAVVASRQPRVGVQTPRFAAVGRGRVFTRVGVLAAVTAAVSTQAIAADNVKPLPKFPVVRAMVLRELVDPPERLAGDIIARSEVKPIFTQLRLMGWTVRDEHTLVRLVPGDTDFVLQKLRTEPGRPFMRKISKYPLAYDRLTRLASLPGGRRLVVDLIRGKGGYRFIGYLTSTTGGKNLGKMLGATPEGVDFNKPTGKIFTAEQLIDRLEASYAEEQQRRAKAPAR